MCVCILCVVCVCVCVCVCAHVGILCIYTHVSISNNV